MKRDPRSIGLEGVNYVEKICILHDDALIKIQQENDRGYDSILEIKDNDNGTYFSVAAQIKTGQSYFKNQGIYVASDEKHFKYWHEHNLLSFLFVYDNQNEECYWIDLSEYVEENIDNKYYIIKAEKTNKFDTKNYQSFIEYVVKKINVANSNLYTSKILTYLTEIGDDEKVKDSLFYALINIRNNILTWLAIIYKFKATKNDRLIKILSTLLAFISHNPDINWNHNNIFANEVRKSAEEILYLTFSYKEICKLLSTYDIEQYTRGDHGQIVFHILELVKDVDVNLVKVIENESDSKLIINAWFIYPLFRKDDSVQSKLFLLEKLLAKQVVTMNEYNDYKRALEEHGLFTY
ncbi:MAG: DUF4365 domain-containing protein [Firmicutes bacterium]|nr:DUF4365 domain-containing protein [Bacillota bacterium]